MDRRGENGLSQTCGVGGRRGRGQASRARRRGIRASAPVERTLRVESGLRHERAKNRCNTRAAAQLAARAAWLKSLPGAGMCALEAASLAVAGARAFRCSGLERSRTEQLGRDAESPGATLLACNALQLVGARSQSARGILVIHGARGRVGRRSPCRARPRRCQCSSIFGSLAPGAPRGSTQDPLARALLDVARGSLAER
jgi:hypothetical protein